MLEIEFGLTHVQEKCSISNTIFGATIFLKNIPTVFHNGCVSSEGYRDSKEEAIDRRR